MKQATYFKCSYKKVMHLASKKLNSKTRQPRPSTSGWDTN